MIVGGPYDDKLFTGNDITGDNVTVYGDWDLEKYGTSPLIEDPLDYNKYDGNDIIDMGDNLLITYGYG